MSVNSMRSGQAGRPQQWPGALVVVDLLQGTIEDLAKLLGVRNLGLGGSHLPRWTLLPQARPRPGNHTR